MNHEEEAPAAVPDPDRPIPRLKDVFANRFLVGAAVNARTIVDAERLVAEQFNSITAENEMKWIRVHPKESEYSFEDADRLVGFARKHGMKMRGHTLVWHNQTPDWLFQAEDGTPVDRGTLLSRLKEHIRTVVGRYRGDVYCWDVVNEAVADDGPRLLRDSRWTQIAGEDVFVEAFEYAHETAPEALLFYNDYNESHPAKREKIYAWIRSLLDRGVPVHGVGLQAHWNVYDPHLDDIRRAIERYASLGLTLHITEMDVSMYAADDRRKDPAPPSDAMLEAQAERYGRCFEMFMAYQDVISSVTFWGTDDGNSWLNDFPVRGRTNWPLLFDAGFRPKKAFWSVTARA